MDAVMKCPSRIPGYPYPEGDHDEWRTDRWHRETDVFPEGFEKPRTCSYCGGVHPQDAIKLIKQGFTIQNSDKNYKAYINAPDGSSCVPPIKLYTVHFTDEEVLAINAAVVERRVANAKAAGL